MFPHKRQQKADIHRYAAELEGEMPPVITMFIYDKCNAVLFPDFAEKHEYSADKEKPDIFFHKNLCLSRQPYVLRCPQQLVLHKKIAAIHKYSTTPEKNMIYYSSYQQKR